MPFFIGNGQEVNAYIIIRSLYILKLLSLSLSLHLLVAHILNLEGVQREV